MATNNTPKKKRGRPATLTPEQRIELHRKRERERYRAKHGIPVDAPVSGTAAAPTGSAPVSIPSYSGILRAGPVDLRPKPATVPPVADDGLEDWER